MELRGEERTRGAGRRRERYIQRDSDGMRMKNVPLTVGLDLL